MVSRENKRASLHEKLQLLRSITNSHVLNQTSIILDAFKYIEELKQKVENSIKILQHHRETQTIKILLLRSCPGLIVFLLEVFEELGLDVLGARVSCTDSFSLQAVGGESEEGERMDAEEVKQAVIQAIRNWSDDPQES